MNSVSAKFCSTLLAGVISLGLVSSPIFAVQDVLDTPAVKSTIASENLLLDVAKAGNRLVAVGSRGHILLSDDKGKSWRQADSVPVSVLLTAVSFPDANNGWAVGHGGVILHSSDGGESWKKQFDGNSANAMIITQAENSVADLERQLEEAEESELEDLEYELEEAQFSLDDAKIDADVGASKPFLDVLFINTNEGFAVGAYGFIFKTEDAGATWENYGSRMDNLDRFHFNAISRIEGGILLIGGEAGTLHRSVDNGDTWESVDSPYEGSFFGVSGTGDENVALAFGLRGHLFRSEDGGVSWDLVDSGTESTLMAASYDGNGKVSIVGNSGSVLYSQDGGRSFSERVRNNRLGNVSVVYVDGSSLALVGENGVNLTSPAGQNK